MSRNRFVNTFFNAELQREREKNLKDKQLELKEMKQKIRKTELERKNKKENGIKREVF